MNALPYAQSSFTLEDVARTLYNRFETEYCEDRNAAVVSTVDHLAKQYEIVGLPVDHAFTEQLVAAAQTTVVPAYEAFKRDELAIRTQKSNRDIKKYVGVANVIGLALEVLLTRGGIIRPPVLLSSIVLNSAVGMGVHWLANTRDDLRLATLEERYTQTVANASRRLEERRLYEQLRPPQ
jgi:hypothetical protein